MSAVDDGTATIIGTKEHSMKVGIIGLGEMGAAMARRLLDQGVGVTVWNRTASAADALVMRGAALAGSAAELATGHDLIISMLANDAASEAVFDADLLASAGRSATGRRALHIAMATLSVDACRRLAELHTASGVDFVSAPVLGRSPLAAAGKLNIVAAGAATAIERAQPVLDLLGKRTWVLGDDPTRAALVKIGVNYNLLHALQAIAESVTLVERGGVDPSAFVEILTDAAFTGSAYGGYGPMIAERRYAPPGFTVGLGRKDLGLAQDAAAGLGVDLAVAPVLAEIFDAALARPDLAELDWSAVAEITRDGVVGPAAPSDASA
ncbi:NAD(P)-dependent oxidoreductase [Schumannella sp. 10F1B-5-1]|uniref:NAD(P)-dependent oxidoreductase n=1 Tax=Schumannella sp. 10F1B-5-1 TaxID=2590780 RepID=UPI0011312B50|nr:NAD(P)-dependent oxidoreductase [Schumannella sp. 10F1B-5-1]TPW72937.1 NAD(P)-dependent oxidoreductase [Schumannella sp. 10F1B-5-1]